MPFLARRAGGSSAGYGQIIRKAGGAPYWINFHGSNASIENAYDVAFDITGNVYTVGRTNNPGTYDFYVAKFDSTGVNQWQVRDGSTNGGDSYVSVAIDSSLNIYVCGTREIDAPNGRYCMIITKINADGTRAWMNSLGGNQYKTDRALRVALDSSNNLFVLGVCSGPNTGINLSKWNSSTGANVWQKKFGGLAGEYYYDGMGLSIDSSGNPHILGLTTSNELQIIKCDSSGAITWQRALTGSSSTENAGDLCVDASGNVYVCGTTTSVNGSGSAIIAQYDSSGTLQWQKAISQTSTGNRLAVDTSGNVYLSGPGVVKFDSTGSILWSRTLGHGGGGGIRVDSTKNTFYTCGSVYTSDNQQMSISKLPADGSLTGTYSIDGANWTYGTGSYSVVSSSLVSSNTSLSSLDSTLPVGSYTLTGSANPGFATITKTL